jgi:hypothetical protein
MAIANSPDTGPPDPRTPLARYARVYDAARAEGAGVAEAMRLAEAELVRDLEQRRRGGGGYPRGSSPGS